MISTDIPKAFHIMAKPSGSACNLNCSYCFFLKKEQLYPGSNFRMPEEVHEAYIRQLFQAHQTQRITVAWQGGEPTLMGIDFFRHTMKLQKKYQKPGTQVENTFQTNGILINDEWCKFFHDNKYLIGLSLDGPKELNDYYRKDRGGHGTFDRVVKAAKLLQKYEVDYNILCTVNSKNVRNPLDVYHFFRDEIDAHYIQFIPIVERENESGFQEGSRVTDRSVKPEQWGRFLIEIFDKWVRRDVGKTFVLNFDGALAGWLGLAGTLCIFGPTCGLGLALEHNGDLYSCDHFVEPGYLLGNILKNPIIELVAGEKQRKFGRDKWESLPQYCRDCHYIFACNGECPKNRFIKTPDGEPGLNYLCAGYKTFFRHSDRYMRIMAKLLRKGRTADGIMKILEREQTRSMRDGAKIGRNDLCPCGSGQKFKKCHGKGKTSPETFAKFMDEGLAASDSGK
jgi:uncharacterized protein